MRIEQERTEELMRICGGQNRRKYLILGAVLLCILLVIGGVVGFNRIQAARQMAEARDQIALGDKALQEGDYETGIECYTKAIQIDDRNPKLYNKRGNAYMALADRDKSKANEQLDKAESDYQNAAKLDKQDEESRIGLADVYTRKDEPDKLRKVCEELEDITGDEDYGDKADTAGLGNSSSNLANQGFFLETPEGTFLAGAPDGSCISRVKEDGSLEPIMQKKHDQSTRNITLTDLNYHEGYIYFVKDDTIFSENGSWKSSICRIRADGTEKKAEKLRETGDGHLRDLQILGGKLYYIQEFYFGGDSPSLHSMTLKGEDDTELYRHVSMFTSDGTRLYIAQSDAPPDYITETIVKSVDPQGKEEAASLTSVNIPEENLQQMIAYKGDLYISTMEWQEDEALGTLRYYKVPADGNGSPEKIHEITEAEHSYLGTFFYGAIARNTLSYCFVDENGDTMLRRIDLQKKGYPEETIALGEPGAAPYHMANHMDRIYFRDKRTDVSEYQHGSMTKDGKDFRNYN